MRIIGGCAKGRRLYMPAGLKLRPTSDMIKEALFNLLPDVAEASFIDLFAGTGSVGIEALSRGAARVVFVESDPRCADVLKRNLLHCNLSGRHDLVVSPSERAIKSLNLRGSCFNMIFMDPPYDRGLVEKTLLEIHEGRILCEDGIVAVQHSIREKAAPEIGRLVLKDERRYGDTVLSFWTLS